MTQKMLVSLTQQVFGCGPDLPAVRAKAALQAVFAVCSQVASYWRPRWLVLKSPRG
jgi:hypothetical protein